MAEQLISMTKDGETINVNPVCVEDHKRLGWTVVEPESVAAEKNADETPVKKKK
jgi:hypothetical protein